MKILIPFIAVILATAVLLRGEEDQPKPTVAIFPLGGNAAEEMREKIGYSLRVKLDRVGTYEVLDGPRMKDLAAESEKLIDLKTSTDIVRKLGESVNAQVLLWGQADKEKKATWVRVYILDLRDKEPRAKLIEKTIHEPTDLRFVSEEILQNLPGIKLFEHPVETAVQHDALAEELWKKNPNLVVDGDFAEAGHWQGIYQLEKYQAPVQDRLPPNDKVYIYRMPVESKEKVNNVLAMKLSRICAENAGLACISEGIKIEPDTRYRLSFRYKSDGPVLHVFVKGYTEGVDIRGKKTMREIYRRQVPSTGATKGQWVEVVDEMNPQHVAFAVQELRIDLYAYLKPGVVMFDDVTLKAVGKQNRTAKDDAIKKPLTRPIGRD